MLPKGTFERARILLATAAVLIASAADGWALTPRKIEARFDSKAIESPGQVIAIRTLGLAELPPGDSLRSGWEAFGARHGGWSVRLDARSGLPTLADGTGIRWIEWPPSAGSDVLALLESKAREFLSANAAVLGGWDGQLVLDREASGPAGDHAFFVTFRQSIEGVPVDGARFDFHVVLGKLVAFGTERWSRVSTRTVPALSEVQARAALDAYLEIADATDVVEDAPAVLTLVPVDPRGPRTGAWEGVRGAGLTHALVWRFRLHVEGEESRWIADVDARTGTVIALVDDTRYDRVKGAAFPLTSDGIGSEGVEKPGLPMPFANVSVNGVSGPAADAHGLYTCGTPGAPVSTTLSGPYVRIVDTCGPVSETTVCGDPLDLLSGPGTNCAVPAGSSAGNTQASRSCFYHVNRMKEKARFWLPGNTWLQGQVVVNSNVNATCNASWSGELNMYRAGSGCRNTCELQGVSIHELGHGLDANDGGGYDNPSEAYADIVAVLESRTSCVGRGFTDSNCGGYGDTCLNCTGIRDQDWNQRAARTPATPQGFLATNCGSGGGPCGKEEHCESYVGAEALFDLATRDLPASGLDADSAWQLADRLFYQSRQGSGGNAYNCALPTSDGCGTSSWFHKLRVADDDDGNLTNGTPHAAAIFAAFARHNIACGTVSDPSNQNSSTCPALARPSLSTSTETGGILLSWSAIPGASAYRIYRNDLGCNRSQAPIAVVSAPATTYLDDRLGEAVDVFYRVQALGANVACESPVSECRAASFVPVAGRVEIGKSSVACQGSVLVRVLDGNVASGPLTLAVWSDSEPAPETVTLTETAPGSRVFEGTLSTTLGAAVSGDGALSVSNGSQITARYLDVNDGSGSHRTVFDTATADCAAAAPTTVRVTDVTDSSAIVRWTTPEPSTGRVEWGSTPALGNVTQDSSLSTDHAVTIGSLSECGRHYFRVIAVDRVGNETLLDAGGQPFAFNAGRIPGLFRDDFESLTGWTLEGEWEIAGPQGKGSNNPDPTAPFSGAKVLGHDLSGLGQRPGNYERNTIQRAISPVFNASGKTGVEIKFRRWLNVYSQATAAVEMRVNGGSWQNVWATNINFGQRESDWTAQTLTLPQADNQSNFQVAFRLSGGGNTTGASSWNVDRFVVRQSSQPLGEACGGCGGAPTFAGAGSAVDAAPCSATGGVTVSWEAAPAWGTGRTGTYSVYRDTVPNFVPGPANRVATGLTVTSFNDTAVANGQTYHYLVRAENDETCGTGPANGGVTDVNLVYRSVTTTSTQPPPPEVDGLSIQIPAGDDLRLTWSAAPAVSRYRLYRSTSPNPGSFTQRDEVTGTAVTDRGAATDGTTWFYLVRAVDACGQEGP